MKPEYNSEITEYALGVLLVYAILSVLSTITFNFLSVFLVMFIFIIELTADLAYIKLNNLVKEKE